MKVPGDLIHSPPNALPELVQLDTGVLDDLRLQLFLLLLPGKSFALDANLQGGVLLSLSGEFALQVFKATTQLPHVIERRFLPSIDLRSSRSRAGGSSSGKQSSRLRRAMCT